MSKNPTTPAWSSRCLDAVISRSQDYPKSDGSVERRQTGLLVTIPSLHEMGAELSSFWQNKMRDSLTFLGLEENGRSISGREQFLTMTDLPWEAFETKLLERFEKSFSSLLGDTVAGEWKRQLAATRPSLRTDQKDFSSETERVRRNHMETWTARLLLPLQMPFRVPTGTNVDEEYEKTARNVMNKAFDEEFVKELPLLGDVSLLNIKAMPMTNRVIKGLDPSISVKHDEQFAPLGITSQANFILWWPQFRLDHRLCDLVSRRLTEITRYAKITFDINTTANKGNPSAEAAKMVGDPYGIQKMFSREISIPPSPSRNAAEEKEKVMGIVFFLVHLSRALFEKTPAMDQGAEKLFAEAEMRFGKDPNDRILSASAALARKTVDECRRLMQEDVRVDAERRSRIMRIVNRVVPYAHGPSVYVQVAGKEVPESIRSAVAEVLRSKSIRHAEWDYNKRYDYHSITLTSDDPNMAGWENRVRLARQIETDVARFGGAPGELPFAYPDAEMAPCVEILERKPAGGKEPESLVVKIPAPLGSDLEECLEEWLDEGTLMDQNLDPITLQSILIREDLRKERTWKAASATKEKYTETYAMVVTKPEKKMKGIEFLKGLVERNDLQGKGLPETSKMSIRWWPDKRDEKIRKMEEILKNTAKSFLVGLKAAEERAEKKEDADWDAMTIR